MNSKKTISIFWDSFFLKLENYNNWFKEELNLEIEFSKIELYLNKFTPC